MARKHLRRRSKSRFILPALVVAFLVIAFGGTAWAWFIYHYPDAVPITSPEVRTIFYPHTSLPNVTVYVTSVFKAQGSISADNPITADVTVRTAFDGVNSTDNVGNYYCCVMYTAAYWANNSKVQAILHGTYLGHGVFTYNGTIEWHEGGPIWSWMLPVSRNVIWNIDRALIAQGPPTTTIGPASDTTNWKGIEFQTREGYSIVFFLPLTSLVAVEVFEILRKRAKDSDADTDSEDSQANQGKESRHEDFGAGIRLSKTPTPRPSYRTMCY